MAAEVCAVFVCGGCRSASCAYRPRGMVESNREFAADDFLLARQDATIGGRRVIGGITGPAGPGAHDTDRAPRGTGAGLVPSGKTGERFGTGGRNERGDYKRGSKARSAKGATRDCDGPPPRCEKEGAAGA